MGAGSTVDAATSGPGWPDVADLFWSCAEADLADTGEVHPAFGAFRGHDLQFLAWLRPFAKGEHLVPVAELAALAVGLGSDRLALSIGARAWSLEDPVPPVTAGADLRQRVVAITLVEAAGARCVTVLHPFTLDRDRVRWQRPVELPGGEGALHGLLVRALGSAGVAPGGDEAVLRSLVDALTARGHVLYLAEDLGRRLAPHGN